MTSLTKLLSVPPDIAARRLLGCYLIRELDEGNVICKIAETEAYDQSDPASHSYRGMTPRTKVMFGPAGYAYVYFTYGMHHCMNVVTGQNGHASAVLIRAVEPIEGLEQIRENRKGITDDKQLTNGPGKLCQAMDINRILSGHNLSNAPLKLEIKSELKPSEIVSATRIGINQAKDTKWRFYIKDSPYVSRYA